MQIKPRSYPHPVLAPFSNDIFGAQFQSTIAVKGIKNAYEIEVTVKTSNRDLESLIASGKAQYSVHLECALTRYRSLFAGDTNRFKFQVPAGNLDGRVEVCTLITAQEDLPSYANGGFHADYQGLTFVVRRGDTLAVAQDAVFVAEKKTDPLRRIPSIFVIVPSEDPEAPAMEIDTTGHKVRIDLSQESFDTYRFLKQDQALHAVLNSMIIVPALIAVLESAKRAALSEEGLAALESRRWFTTVARRLKELGIDIAGSDSLSESAAALAQRLIGEPLRDGLKTLRSYEEGDEEEVA